MRRLLAAWPRFTLIGSFPSQSVSTTDPRSIADVHAFATNDARLASTFENLIFSLEESQGVVRYHVFIQLAIEFASCDYKRHGRTRYQ